MIYFALPEALDLDDAYVQVEILDGGGNVIRRRKTDANTGVEGGG